MLDLTVKWDLDPAILHSPLEIRYYGLFFALSFLLGYWLVKRMSKDDGLTDKDMDRLLIYVMIATVLGARLGHVFFYDWADYKDNLIDIFKIWEGGLASHGAAIGIIISLWLLSRRHKYMTMLFSLDRAVVAIALAAFFIRMGNLMNSEIVGEPTDAPWGFWFTRLDAEPVYRHPTQLYEALCYLLIFGFLYWLYKKRKAGNRPGLLFGAFLVLLFTTRFLLEFTKVNQASFIDESELINMGQILSIPFIITGLFFIVRAMKRPASDPPPLMAAKAKAKAA